MSGVRAPVMREATPPDWPCGSEKDHVGAQQLARLKPRLDRLDLEVGQSRQVTMDLADPLPGGRCSQQTADLEIGVPSEQPQQFAARVPGGTNHSSNQRHVQNYTGE